MNRRLALLRSPVALLACCALLCAALAGIVASAGRASAAPATVGSFTLSPASGDIADATLAASATTSAGCPDGSAGYKPALGVFQPGTPVDGDAVASIGKATTAVPTGTAPFTVDLGPHASGLTLQTALRSWIPTGSLDGTYTLTLTCQSGYGVAPRFLAKVTVVGETWTMVQQQVTAVSLKAPADVVSVNGDLALTAEVSPTAATGSVEFKRGDESLGTASVTNGVATKTVKAPAIGGPHSYTAVFTSADQDAYGDAEGGLLVSIGYIVTARAADGALLGDTPTLAIGDSARITVQGFTPGSTVKVTQENATGATFADATADARGTVADYAFTVPDRTISGETDLYFAEGGSANNRASFTFNAVDGPTGDPTDPAGLEVTDEDGNPLDADPNLEPGQTVKITAAGYTADAAVKVTLADSEETFEDAKANADGTVEEYAFTVPEEIEDGDHTLTLAEDGTGGHSVDFDFTTGAETGGSPGPSDSASASGDTAGTDSGGTGGGSGSDGGSGTGTTGGTMASTGAHVGAVALTALALLSAGAALVLHMRRKGLLAFAGDTPQHR